MLDDVLKGVKPAEKYVRSHKTAPVAMAGGISSIALMCLVFVSLPVIAAAGSEFIETDTPDIPPFEYVEARLLKFGEIKDPEALPDRIVPALPTAPEEVLPLDKNENKPPSAEEPENKPKPQRDAVTDDKLRQVFDRARAFAEIQDDYVPEGHPDGVPDGDVTDPALASIGATYGHRIKRIIQDRWIVPTLLTEQTLRKLKVKILIKVDIDMTIVSVQFTQKSGNRLFDDSVQNAIDLVRKEVRKLPPPPEAIAPTVFGGGISLKLHGADASYE